MSAVGQVAYVLLLHLLKVPYALLRPMLVAGTVAEASAHPVMQFPLHPILLLILCMP